MDTFFRPFVIYIFLLILFRITGKRGLAEITTFDFVLLLIIGEATQQALLGDDFSVTNALLVIVTLISIDIVLSLLKQKYKTLERWIDGLPLVIVQDGQMLKERTDKARVDEAEILEAARRLQGVERMDQIKYAVLETDGGITVIPKQSAS
jgi:uncharacterized membrane protein YcaP (DUF421 family)